MKKDKREGKKERGRVEKMGKDKKQSMFLPVLGFIFSFCFN